MPTLVLFVALTLALAALALWRRLARRAAPAPAPAAPRERFVPRGPGTAPRPGDAGPFADALRRAVDPVVPPPVPGEAVQHDDAEVKGVLEAVLRRVNAGGRADLRLVSFEGVRKSVDRFKTVRYEVTMHAYSRARTTALAVDVEADVSAENTMYVRSLKTRGGAKDAGGAAPSNGIGFEDRFAAFEPAVAPF